MNCTAAVHTFLRLSGPPPVRPVDLLMSILDAGATR